MRTPTTGNDPLIKWCWAHGLLTVRYGFAPIGISRSAVMYTFFSWLFDRVTISAKRRNRWLGIAVSLICVIFSILFAYARARHNLQ